MRPTNKGLFSGPRLAQSFLVLLFFLAYLFLYLEIATLALGKSSAVSSLSKSFIPAFKNLIPGFSYVGFVVPLAVAFASLILKMGVSRQRPLSLRRWVVRDRYWLFAALLSVGFWYLIPGFASGGHTDFPLAILTCVYVGWHLERKQTGKSVLEAITLGFGIGFVSDLQSQTFFTGIFGGWGLLDGDLLSTIALPLATITTLAFYGALEKSKFPGSVQVIDSEATYRNKPTIPT